MVGTGTSSGPDGLRFVVGVGASAGGLDALQEFLRGLDGGPSAAFVVAQHLAPEHHSVLVELLARETAVPVVAAEDGMPLSAGTMYVTPPGQDVLVAAGGVLRVASSGRGGGPSPSIDRLFVSVAEVWGAYGVGVLLSGTGSDGTLGMRAIKAEEGLTIAQSPESARFDAMPRSAISRGVVDLVLAPGEMGAALARLAESGPAWLGAGIAAGQQPTLGNVVAQLRRATGVDFSGYKESTLRRQVSRRMAIRQIGGVEDYLPVLSSEPAEARALMANLLVTVTSFFRDPEAFDALAQRLAADLASRASGEPVRVWVPGCATGEEVYSLGMLVAEALGRPADLADRVKIFGTDLDESSLAVARRAVYPASAAENVPPGLQLRYLSERGPDVEVVPELRDCVVFARHNVIEDPPFPRTDLVSCRNTLIYFTPHRQARVLEFLRYSLRPGGLLFLGQSESLGSDSSGFVPADARQRIFVRSTDPAVTPSPPAAGSVWLAPTAAPRARGSRPQVVTERRAALLEALLRAVAAPCLVIDASLNVVEIAGDVSAYCRLPQGPVSSAMASILRPELRGGARHLLLQLRSGQRSATSGPIALGSSPPVRLEARSMQVDDDTFAVLSFVAVPDAAGLDMAQPRGTEFDQELERLERELLTSQETLNASLEELEAANEELQASSEEVQATNEELQASFEELETSNEELQATNEELSNLSQQNRLRSEELSLVNDDLVNVQSSLSQGMVIVDDGLRVTRYSPLAVRLFALVEDDIGRSLLGVPTTLPVTGLTDALHAVVAGGERQNLEVRGPDVALLVQVLPYVASSGGRRGAIITLTDVTELVALRHAAEAALRDFTATTDALAELVWKRDATTGAVVYVSRRIKEFTGHTQAELAADPGLLDAGIDEADRHRVRAARESDPTDWSVEYRLTSTDGTQRWVRETARLVPDEHGAYVAGTLVDVTDRVAAERIAAEQAELLAHRASYDDVTGLLNRHALRKLLARELARAERSGDTVALVWLDLDMFKQVNDEHGHDAGDEVLRQVAERLRSVVREQDAVGRLGGDEFGVVVTGLNEIRELDPFFDRVREAVRQPIDIGGGQVVVAASLGVAIGPGNGSTPETLMRAADEAMYTAKRGGGDAVAHFEEAMKTGEDQRRDRLRALTAAVAEQAFEMHYQPIVHLGDNRVWGLEALVRWRRGTEIISAGEFIPFCEDTGLIRDLGVLTADRVLQDRAALAAAGWDGLNVTLNLSAKQLSDPDCLDRLRGSVSPPGLAGLVVEVTESVFLPDQARALANLRALDGLGVTLAIDDFGSGFSNLRLLESLAPAYIKLDSSFLALADKGTGQALVKAAIDLAHALGAHVIAEGIEEPSQRQRVAHLGAELGQGYGIARPMPLPRALAWLAQSTGRQASD